MKASTSAAQPVRVAFLNCHDATLFCADVNLTPFDEARLALLLGWLRSAGALLLPGHTAAPAAGLDDVLAYLRHSLGALLVEAALTADPIIPAATGGAPVAVMPIWSFEAEGADPADRDVLLSSGRLWGTDVLIEALRADGPDDSLPATTIRARFDRWVAAAGGGRERVTLQPPGETGWYVLGAISAAA